MGGGGGGGGRVYVLLFHCGVLAIVGRGEDTHTHALSAYRHSFIYFII